MQSGIEEERREIQKIAIFHSLTLPKPIIAPACPLFPGGPRSYLGDRSIIPFPVCLDPIVVIVEKAWTQKKLVEGNFFPMISAESLAIDMRDFLNLVQR